MYLCRLSSGIGLSALAASVPLIILFYMLAFRQAKGHIAAVAGLVGALLVAILVEGFQAEVRGSFQGR